MIVAKTDLLFNGNILCMRKTICRFLSLALHPPLSFSCTSFLLMDLVMTISK